VRCETKMERNGARFAFFSPRSDATRRRPGGEPSPYRCCASSRTPLEKSGAFGTCIRARARKRRPGPTTRRSCARHFQRASCRTAGCASSPAARSDVSPLSRPNGRSAGSRRSPSSARGQAISHTPVRKTFRSVAVRPALAGCDYEFYSDFLRARTASMNRCASSGRNSPASRSPLIFVFLKSVVVEPSVFSMIRCPSS
jgi:hypothetical protein